MKFTYLFLSLITGILFHNQVIVQEVPSIRLIVRTDDMGVTHSTNQACIDAYKSGIAKSVEVMVPTPWYLEAVQLLKEHPEYDAGIHLVLNCEWSNLKWRPLTGANTLTDSNGYFFPTPWKGSPDFPSLQDHQPNYKEAEKELRAQIEMALKHIPRLSHISTHMGFEDSHPELKKIVTDLSLSYNLPLLQQPSVMPFPGNPKTEAAFIAELSKLERGKTYLFVTHPAYNTEEMQTIFTPTYQNVGADRAADLSILTSKKVTKALKKHNIEVISVAEYLKLK